MFYNVAGLGHRTYYIDVVYIRINVVTALPNSTSK